MTRPTLHDIIEKGIRYYAQLEDYAYRDLCDAPIPYKNTRENRLTIFDVLNKGVQHYVQIAHKEYQREKPAIKSAEVKKQNVRLGDWPDSNEDRWY